MTDSWSAEGVSDGVLTPRAAASAFMTPHDSVSLVSLTACKIRHMKFRSALLQLLIVFAAVGSANAAELNPQALTSWEKLRRERQAAKRFYGGPPGLWRKPRG
jgi:hypothetical protein